jgi:hypothetical protein
VGRKRPLGASRILWEIGPEGTDATALRWRLGLDSGYLSRLIQRLQAEGLVSVAPSPSLGRVRGGRAFQRRAVRRPLVREAAQLRAVQEGYRPVIDFGDLDSVGEKPCP